MWIDWTPAAHAAAPACEEVDETTFRAYVFDAHAGVERGDVELTTGIVDEVWDRLGCLSFSPDPGLWAELLVSRAIVEFSRGGDWQAPLAAALRLRKGIDRGVGPGHPIASFEPLPDPPMGPPVPPKARVLVDGRATPVLPPAEGLWLVQKTDGRFWNTLVLQNEPVPEGWATAPVVSPPRVVAWARLGGAFGLGAGTSRADWPGSRRFPGGPDGEGEGLALGAQGELHATFYSPLGVHAAARISSFPGSPGLDARVLGIAERGVLTLGGGFAASTVDVYRRDPDDDDEGTAPQLYTSSPFVRYAVGSVAVHPGHRPVADGGRPFDVGLLVGGSAAGALFETEVGVGSGFGGDTLFRLGLVSAVRTGRFAYSGVDEGLVTAETVRVLLRVDVVLGEY